MRSASVFWVLQRSLVHASHHNLQFAWILSKKDKHSSIRRFQYWFNYMHSSLLVLFLLQGTLYLRSSLQKTMRTTTAERDEMYTCIKNYPDGDEMYTCVEKIDEVTAFRFFSPADWSQSYRFRRFWRQVFCFETDGDNSCYRHTKWTILSNWKLV